MGAAIQHVGAAVLGPHAAGLEAVEHGHQRGRAVAHGRVDHLALAGLPRADDPRHQAKGQIEGAATEIAHQVQRRDRLVLGADGVQGPGDGDVVHVVAGGVGVGPRLAPAGHAAVDDLRIALQNHVGPETQALHDARPEALEHRVGAFQQLQAGLDGLGVLEIQTDGAAAARGHVGGGAPALPLAVDTHHVGAQVRQQHATERPGPDPGELDDLQSGQRSLAHSLNSQSILRELSANDVRSAKRASRRRAAIGRRR